MDGWPVAPVGLDGELLCSMDGEQVGGKRPPAWSTTLFGSAFAAIHEPTIKLTDPRWWATEAPERLAQGAAILGVHPALSVQAADAIAFRLEIPRLVRMLRILTNFDMDSRLVLSLVIAGQSPLRSLLARDDQEAMARRIVHYAQLRLLSREELAQYVAHRRAVAGAARVPFDERTLDALFEIGRGNRPARRRRPQGSVAVAVTARPRPTARRLARTDALPAQPSPVFPPDLDWLPRPSALQQNPELATLAVLHTTLATLVLSLVAFNPQLAHPRAPARSRDPRRPPPDGECLVLPAPAHPVLP